MVEKKLKFEFSGKMARLLGRESVSSGVAALFELVKNSYDADASRVKMEFVSSSGPEIEKIIIEDNGDGMNVDEIEKNWMVIGTYSKEKNQTSRNGRKVVGNKGVGRFSTEKLAKKMKVISKPKFSPEQIELTVNWEKYDEEGITFNDVENTAEIIEYRKDETHGTKIILEQLRESWDENIIQKLSLAISALVLPEELITSSKDRFEVDIIAKQFPSFENPRVQSLLLRNAPYVLHSTISKDSSIAKIEINGKDLSGKDLATIVEHVDFTEKKYSKLENGEVWEPFGKCKFSLYFYPGKSIHEPWDKYYNKALKISKIKDALEEIHGVKIYRDKFWARPYGEKGNDWLNLEKDRVQSNLKVGNTQVIGFVEISQSENPLITDTTTRERIVENIQFASLRHFVKQSIEKLNEYRIVENKRLRERKGYKQYQNIVDLDVSYVFEKLEDSPLPVETKKDLTRTLKSISQNVHKLKAEKEQDYSELERESKLYRNMATIGISSATTSHEIHNIISSISEIPKSIKNAMENETIQRDLICKRADLLHDQFIAIKQFLRFVRTYVRSIKDDFQTYSKKENVEFLPFVSKITDSFSGIFKRKKIQFEYNVFPENFSVYVNKADYYSIFINLITNSIKALDDLPPDEEKKIKITISKENYYYQILLSNNGPPISEQDRETIFNIFVSKYEEGTGLGLTIIKEIVDEYEGKIEVLSQPEFPRGATFSIKIPLEILKK